MRWQVAQSAEWRWWKNYLRNRPVDPYLEWKRGYWRGVLKHVENIHPLAPGAQLLDAGCGPAGIYTILDQQHVTAFDPLLDRYAKELDHFSAASYPWVKFSQMKMEELGDQEMYDAVFCLNVINHVENLPLSISNLVKACKPGGIVAMSIDAHNHRWAKPIYRSIPFDILHPHQYDLEEYSALLRSHGSELLDSILLKEGFWFNHYLLVAKRY